MASETDKKLSPGKRAAGLLLIVVVGLVSFGVSFWIVRHFSQTPETEEVTNGPDVLAHIFITFSLGFLSLGAGVLGYVLVLATQCFTFDWRKPFWKAFRVKLYVANIIVPLLIIFSVGFFVSMVVTPILMAIGLSRVISFIVPIAATLVIGQLVLVWVNIWVPLEKTVVKKRLAGRGISNENTERGMYVGISDPGKSSFKKMTVVEEDVGMLWMKGDELIYVGDSDTFRIQRGQLIEVERAADSGGMAAYGGAVHVILRFREAEGAERRIRLHTQGSWTLGGVAKTLDSLAQRLVSWQRGES
jgi:hypothetical protein